MPQHFGFMGGGVTFLEEVSRNRFVLCFARHGMILSLKAPYSKWHIFQRELQKCSLGKVMSMKSQLISLPGEVMSPLITALQIEPRERRFHRRTIETTETTDNV